MWGPASVIVQGAEINVVRVHFLARTSTSGAQAGAKP